MGYRLTFTDADGRAGNSTLVAETPQQAGDDVRQHLENGALAVEVEKEGVDWQAVVATRETRGHGIVH